MADVSPRVAWIVSRLCEKFHCLPTQALRLRELIGDDDEHDTEE